MRAPWPVLYHRSFIRYKKGFRLIAETLFLIVCGIVNPWSKSKRRAPDLFAIMESFVPVALFVTCCLVLHSVNPAFQIIKLIFYIIHG